MAKQLAHDLTDNKWRSQDINVAEEDSEVTFESIGLKPPVLAGLRDNGFVRLSAVQLHAIPIGRCGLDLIVQSKSGTGKTCVFVVTALEVIEAMSAVQVLVVCPTREIAVQTNDVMTALGSHLTHFRSCPVIGGTKFREDVNMLTKCQAVVGTPGRIRQLIELNALKTQSIRLLVLDECDKLMDNNFKEQIDFIFECLPQNKQMIAVSATMSTDLANFLRQYMRTPVFVRLNADNPALIGVKQYYRVSEYHHLNHINFDNKIEPLIEILKRIPFSQCLVFSNYQTRARMLCDKLNALSWKTTYISAEKCQTERLKAISKLKKYKCRILVSTDLTARGIDVENVNLVVNMDIPFDGQTYLHRIGRAGRFGTKGIAITMASSGREEEQFQKIVKECKLNVEELRQPIPSDIWKMDDFTEQLCDIENKTVSNKTKKTKRSDSELNDPFREYFPQLYNQESEDDDPEHTLMSYPEICREYEKLKANPFRVPVEERGIQVTAPVLCPRADINGLSKKITRISVVDESDFIPPVSQSQSANDYNRYQNSSECRTNGLNRYQNCKQSLLREVPKAANDSRERRQPTTGVTSGQLAAALFPAIHSVSSPMQYNEWIRRNIGFWMQLSKVFPNLDYKKARDEHKF